LNIYLDASVIVPLFLPDHYSGRAEALVRTFVPVPILSNFAAAEFASAVSRRVRTRHNSTAEARAAFADFDEWARSTVRIEIEEADIAQAEGLLRRLDLPLRTMDAIHIAAAGRIEAPLATFDRKMAASAQSLGIAVLSE
jgi:uncharacterized protein